MENALWLPKRKDQFHMNLFFTCLSKFTRASLVAQLVKNLTAMQETWVRSLACLPAGRPASLPPSLPSLPPLSPSLPSPACWELLRFQAGRGTQHRPARSAQGPAGSPALGLRYGAQTHGRKAPPPTPHTTSTLCLIYRFVPYLVLRGHLD